MINESALFKQLQKLETPLFVDYKSVRECVRKLWRACLAANKTREILQKNTQKILACWTGDFGVKQEIKPISIYQVIAIDGSQIYPDRHEGVRAALVNTGGIWLSYGEQKSQAQFFSTPEILCENSGDHELQTAAFVDCKRHERELQSGIAYVKNMCTRVQENTPVCVLFDGSLIFWHLENNPKLCDYFFACYCDLIRKLQETGVLCAWYTSLPHSRDLVHIAQAYAQQKKQEINVHVICDCDVLEFWLQKHERTQVFESAGAHIEKYPAFMRPHFFYVHTGAEIARIEIPAWCVHDQEQINLIARIIIDQCVKGDGYPISCAHAHEQVVVHQRDRLLFQQLICKMADVHQMPVTLSRKLIKKRSLAI